MKNLILDSIKIIKEVKWDYARMAQLTKLWGGPKKAAASMAVILIGIGSFLGTITTLSFQKLFKHFLSKLQTSKNINSPNDENEQKIQQKTDEYLTEVQIRKENNQSTDDIDEEYNNSMKELLDSH
ncbi:hypothetical protein B7726_04965 [Streptococcus oralis subsp. tigurinus]|jgi:hypothetical protein|uniref:hypothetical protein n=1 Tax=Streptococcus oralis TaxID=1303 RepID=UPI000A1063F3|nr:hypothetical protein [Streptococcus oralis]ORO42346.1 hypothetical protein B7726_04965 [Streptococcus oralis subsp. tigurinus]